MEALGQQRCNEKVGCCLHRPIAHTTSLQMTQLSLQPIEHTTSYQTFCGGTLAAPERTNNSTLTHQHRGDPCKRHVVLHATMKAPTGAAEQPERKNSPSAEERNSPSAEVDLGDTGGVTPMAGVAKGSASLLHRLTVLSGSHVRCWYRVFLAFRMSSLAPCRHTSAVNHHMWHTPQRACCMHLHHVAEACNSSHLRPATVPSLTITDSFPAGALC